MTLVVAFLSRESSGNTWLLKPSPSSLLGFYSLSLPFLSLLYRKETNSLELSHQQFEGTDSVKNGYLQTSGSRKGENGELKSKQILHLGLGEGPSCSAQSRGWAAASVSWDSLSGQLSWLCPRSGWATCQESSHFCSSEIMPNSSSSFW